MFKWRIFAASVLVLLATIPVWAADLSSAAPFVRLGEYGKSPSLIIDSFGNTHSIWIDTSGAQAQVVESTGTGLTPDTRPVMPITVATDDNHQLALTTTSTTLYLAAIVDSTQICYLHRSLPDGDWTQPECLADSSPHRNIQIAVQTNGTVALAWEGTGIAMVVRGANSDWNRLPDPGSGDALPRSQPQLVATATGFIIVWVQQRQPGPGNSTRTEVLGSTWNGNGWTSPTSISGFDARQPQWKASDPTLAWNGTDTISIAYTLFAPGDDYNGPKNRLFYRQGSLDRLATAEPVAEFATSPSITSSGATIDLAWAGKAGATVNNLSAQNMEILWSRRTTKWSQPQDISHTADPSRTPTVATAAGGRSIVVWSDGDAVLLASSSTTGSWPTSAPVDEPALRAYTNRADLPVITGQASRSWLWGPAEWITEREAYQDAPDGYRRVFYYDKARIEVTDPNIASSDPSYFTNGLLVTEMASGRIQYGDQLFISDNPAKVPVAGDPGNTVAPTYASFRSLVYIPEIGQAKRTDDRTGLPLDQCIARDGTVTVCVPVAQTAYGHFVPETGHNIATPFWAFLNQQGLVVEDGKLIDGLVFPWISTMGYPITEPYWTKAIVQGTQRDVLVQLFQRRILTYTPTNPTDFQVEMGNVGQHYYQWRYSKTPWTRTSLSVRPRR